VDGVFVRNGSEHQPNDAVAHLKMKMENAMNSWFAPNKENWTAEMFIKKLASKSSLSGKPYLIKYRNGKTVLSSKWLTEKLNSYHKASK